ncbi:MAG: hypothetical protein F4123_00160, partial [Gemmatimonadetes bacterium]|nr:hypothetical protein [Gemmatimonadota bacterium]
MVGIDLDLKLVVGLHKGVAPSPELRDRARIFGVHARAYVKGVAGIRDPHLGAFTGRIAVAGPVAAKSGDGHCDLPDGVVQAAVEGGGDIGKGGGHGRGRVAAPVREGGVGGGGGLGPGRGGGRRMESDENGGGASHGILAYRVEGMATLKVPWGIAFVDIGTRSPGCTAIVRAGIDRWQSAFRHPVLPKHLLVVLPQLRSPPPPLRHPQR